MSKKLNDGEAPAPVVAEGAPDIDQIVAAVIAALDIPALVDAAMAAYPVRLAAREADRAKDADAALREEQALAEAAIRKAEKDGEKAVKAAQARALAVQERAARDYAALVAAPLPATPVLLGEATAIALRLAGGSSFLPDFEIEVRGDEYAVDASGVVTLTTEIIVPGDLVGMTVTQAVLIAEGAGDGALVLVSSVGGLPVGAGRRGRIPAGSLALRPINAAQATD